MNLCDITRSTEEIKRTIADSGISIAEWARENRFSAGLVYQILEGRRKCLRGQSHRIAVALGLKTGTLMDVQSLSAFLARRGAPGEIKEE